MKVATIIQRPLRSTPPFGVAHHFSTSPDDFHYSTFLSPSPSFYTPSSYIQYIFLRRHVYLPRALSPCPASCIFPFGVPPYTQCLPLYPTFVGHFTTLHANTQHLCCCCISNMYYQYNSLWSATIQ